MTQKIWRIEDPIQDRFVISSQHVWRPGSYESEEAARMAFRFPDETLITLQARVAPGVVTLAMLRAEPKAEGT